MNEGCDPARRDRHVGAPASLPSSASGRTIPPMTGTRAGEVLDTVWALEKLDTWRSSPGCWRHEAYARNM